MHVSRYLLDGSDDVQRRPVVDGVQLFLQLDKLRRGEGGPKTRGIKQGEQKWSLASNSIGLQTCQEEAPTWYQVRRSLSKTSILLCSWSWTGWGRQQTQKRVQKTGGADVDVLLKLSYSNQHLTSPANDIVAFFKSRQWYCSNGIAAFL